MMADRLADNRFEKYCCICGKVVKVTGESTTKDRTVCSYSCHQLSVFFQGLICGHALCILVRHYGKERIPETDFADCRRKNLQDLDNLIKVEPDVPDTGGKCDTDRAANVLEELLQVTFDQECQVADTDDSNDTDNHSDKFQQPESSWSSGNSSSSVRKVQSTDASRTTSHFYTTTKTEPIQPLSLHALSELLVTKEHKTKEHNTQVSRKMSDVTYVSQNQCDDFQGDVSISAEEHDTVTSSDKKKVTCDICGEKFVKTHLYVHMKAKHIEKLTKKESDLMFTCSECSKKFEKQSLLNKHLAKKHPSCEKLTKLCTLCHKGFSNQIGLSVHMRHVHKTLSPKECDLCQRTFKSCKELSRHKLRDHKLRAHICHLCGKNFAYSHALKSHLDAHAGVKKHFCEVCGEGFVRITSLCGHRVSAHSRKDDNVHRCEICESSFPTKALLSKHLFEAHFTGPYAVKDYKKQKCETQNQNCLSCKIAHDHSGQCPLHTANDKTKQFICSHCGKNFSKAHYLKAHEKQHQEAKFSCDICCKRFTYKCNLKAHQSTHSSDKPFQCTVCSKKFRLKFLLDDHQRTHNRDLLFKCYVCGRGLTRIPNLKRHIRVMHPEVSYEQP